MQLSRLLSLTPGSPNAPAYPDIALSALTDDSRKVTPGSLYVAIRGEKHDGHNFVQAACTAGAAAIVAEQRVSLPASVPLILVDDSRRFLAHAAAVWTGLRDIQQRGELPVVGITGTNGKSTTAFLVQAMLQFAQRPTAVIGTVLYDLVGRTVSAPMTTPPPLDLSAMLVEAHRHGARAAAMEVSSHSLDQRRADGIQFAAAVFTNLTGDHLDYHKTMDQYRAAKQRLFRLLPQAATAVVNIDDPAGGSMLEGCSANPIRFGFDASADLRAEVHELTAAGSRFTVRFRGRSCELRTPLIGRHNVQNLLAAIGTGLGLGLDLDLACRGAGSLRNVRGRLERVDTGNRGFSVVVDYAHTDDALQNVASALRPLTPGRLYCVFGCGGDRDRTKRPRMARVAAQFADRIIVTSDNPRTEDPDAIIAEIRNGIPTDRLDRCAFVTDRANAIRRAIEEARAGDTILIAGKGHEDYQILGTRKVHFDDVEVTRSALEALPPAGQPHSRPSEPRP